MDTHPLNLAHQQYRRAEAHLKYNRFDDAIQCHHNAAELLLDAMKSTTTSVALESITLQHNYHLKQKDLVKHKKEQYGRVKKALDNLKNLSKDSASNTKCQENSKIQLEIYKTMNEADSLLDFLTHKRDSDKISDVVGATVEKDNVDGKTEKKPSHIVEELQILNHNLHSLVDQLVTQVEVLKDENVTLHERVLYLEKERNKYLNLHTAEFIQDSNFSNLSLGNNHFSAITDENCSKPYLSGGTRKESQPHFDLSAFKDD